MKASILLPFDGSPSAFRALDQAIERAQSEPIVVHLLNVEPKLEDYGMVRAYLPEERQRAATAERAHMLLQPAVERLEAGNVPHETHVEWGEVPETIDSVARRLDCDSIVMGTRGMGPIGGLVFGSTATRLVHLTKLPVTLVK